MKKLGAVESLRGLAALYVFISHLALHYQINENATYIFRFGQEAVMLFFLVSGFVIMYSMELARDKSFLSYLGRRFFRIYPIFLLSLALSYIFAAHGSFDIVNLMGNVVMLQDFGYAKPGVLFNAFAGNTPLWSLSYEWWFYLMFFPLYRLVAERFQLVLVTAAGVAAVVIYNETYFQPMLFLAYFPIWWTGAEIGRAVARDAPIPFGKILMATGAITVAFGAYAATVFAKGHEVFFGLHPVLEVRHAGASFAMVLLLYAIKRRSLNLGWLLAPFSIVAPISYGIYALHYPVLGGTLFAGMANAVQIPAIVVTVFALAWFAEVPYQRFVLRLRAVWRARRLSARAT